MRWALAAWDRVRRPIVWHEGNGRVSRELSLSLNVDIERMSMSNFGIR